MRLSYLCVTAPLAPLLHDLAPHYAVHEDRCHLYLRVPAHQAEVLPSIVHAAPGDAGHDLVAFCYLVLDDGANVREGGVLLGDLTLVALTARLLASKGGIIDEL